MPLSSDELKALVELRKIDAILGNDPSERLMAELQDLLLLSWDQASRSALTEAVRELAVQHGRLTRSLPAAYPPSVGGRGRRLQEEDVERVLAGLSRRLGPQFAATVESELLEIVLAVYEGAQRDVLREISMPVRPSFNLIDERAVSWLHSHHLYWVREHFELHTRERVVKLGTKALREGLSRTAAGALFQEELGPVLGQSQSYWQMFANHSVTRSQEFGRVEQYAKAGVEYLEIRAVIDHRTSDICRFMHRKKVRVSTAVELRDRLMAARDPDDVRRIAAWMSPEEARAHVEQGVVEHVALATPPFHFGCRTRTIAVR